MGEASKVSRFAKTTTVRRCRDSLCANSMAGRAPQAKHCSRQCGQAFNARANYPANEPSCLLVAPRVVATEPLDGGAWRVTLDDGRQLQVLGASPQVARTRARMAAAKQPPTEGAAP